MRIFFTFLFFIQILSNAFSESSFLSSERLLVKFDHSINEVKSFWKNKQSVNLNNNPIRIKLSTFYLSFQPEESAMSYSLEVGHVNSKRMQVKSLGRSDSRLGVKWNLYDSDPYLDWNHHLEIGLIIKGSYNDQVMNAAGDGANGIDFSYSSYKIYHSLDAIFSHKLALVVKSNDVPVEAFYQTEISKRFFTLNTLLGLKGYSSFSGIDIGQVGYQFPRDLNKVNEKSLSYFLELNKSFGKHSVSISYLNTIKGQNTNKLSGIKLGIYYRF